MKSSSPQQINYAVIFKLSQLHRLFWQMEDQSTWIANKLPGIDQRLPDQMFIPMQLSYILANSNRKLDCIPKFLIALISSPWLSFVPLQFSLIQIMHVNLVLVPLQGGSSLIMRPLPPLAINHFPLQPNLCDMSFMLCWARTPNTCMVPLHFQSNHSQANSLWIAPHISRPGIFKIFPNFNLISFSFHSTNNSTSSCIKK